MCMYIYIYIFTINYYLCVFVWSLHRFISQRLNSWGKRCCRWRRWTRDSRVRIATGRMYRWHLASGQRIGRLNDSHILYHRRRCLSHQAFDLVILIWAHRSSIAVLQNRWTIPYREYRFRQLRICFCRRMLLAPQQLHLARWLSNCFGVWCIFIFTCLLHRTYRCRSFSHFLSFTFLHTQQMFDRINRLMEVQSVSEMKIYTKIGKT